MPCCGKKNRSIKKQVVDRPKKSTKTVTVQRIQRNQAAGGQQKRTVTVQRQRVVPRQKCHACGFPTMAVNIAGRERLQCSNPVCRIIIK